MLYISTCHVGPCGSSSRLSTSFTIYCPFIVYYLFFNIHSRGIHVIGGGGYVSYLRYQGFCQDTCHMRRRLHVIRGGGHVSYLTHTFMNDTCHFEHVRVQLKYPGF